MFQSTKHDCIIVHNALINTAGWVLSADTVRQALSQVGIKSPDWRKIGEELGLQLRGQITAHIFFEGWAVHESDMSWEIVSQALGRISGYESAAKKARERTGNILPCS